MVENNQGAQRKLLASRRGWLLLALVLPSLFALFQVADFYRMDRTALGLGMPIDDAYIFQRYAENLALGAGFAFNPHETSFGCTSLIWPLLLSASFRALPFLSHVTVMLWLGGLLFAGAAAGAAWIVLKRTGQPVLGMVAGFLAAASPNLMMNAISGMETPLSMALLTLFAGVALSEKPRPLLAGMVAGLLTLNRPEAMYFAPAAALVFLALKVFKKPGFSIRQLLLFLAPWAVLCIPAGLIIRHFTGSILPTTYLGKIVSSVPQALNRGIPERIFWSALSLADGWGKLLWPLHALAPLLAVGLIFCLVTIWRDARRDGPAGWPRAGSLLLLGYLFLPGSYGFSFPIHPPFGGYYIRYIAPLHLIIVISGLIGFSELLAALALRYPERSWKWRKYIPVFAALLLVYQGWLWSFQVRDAREVFRREVGLNTGLRMAAAQWLSRPENVPPEAKVMVGYTGLGVVGGNCGRYVLDLGALINPDIFPYYRRATLDLKWKRIVEYMRDRGVSLINPDIFPYYRRATLEPQLKWKRIVEYMRDRGVGFYVSFAFPPAYQDRLADPAQTPGFTEVARLGVPGEPKTPYEQIRIYKIEWRP